jgi:hypothetical protein
VRKQEERQEKASEPAKDRQESAEKYEQAEQELEWGCENRTKCPRSASESAVEERKVVQQAARWQLEGPEGVRQRLEPERAVETRQGMPL